MLELRHFADQDDCLAVIAAYQRSRESHAEIVGDPFFDRRVMWIGSFPDAENPARRILQRWRRRATLVASILAGRPMYSDTIQVVRWDGQAMPPHRDHCHLDGTPNPSPWRELAGIIYLNGGYAGGRLVFPEIGQSYAPVSGALLLFSGALLHGVEAAAGAPRYTSPAWFTRDPEHCDPWAAINF
jgi:2OG-Fe(II) oxygenase superfamily